MPIALRTAFGLKVWLRRQQITNISHENDMGGDNNLFVRITENSKLGKRSRNYIVQIQSSVLTINSPAE